MMVNGRATHIGDNEDDVVHTEGFDHDCTDKDTQTNNNCIHDHEHNHSSLETVLVGTHLNEGPKRL